jgi:hypothetical protein
MIFEYLRDRNGGFVSEESVKAVFWMCWQWIREFSDRLRKF